MAVMEATKSGAAAEDAGTHSISEENYTIYRQLKTLWRSLASSPHRYRIWLLSGGIVFAIGLNMIGQVRLNNWKGDFYNALERADADAFITQIGVFVLIVAVLLTLVVAETWIREMLEVRLREWLTHDLLDQWLAPNRAYLLGFAGEIGENPDQRMQADCQRLTEFGADLSIGLFAIKPVAPELHRRALGALQPGGLLDRRCAWLHHSRLSCLVCDPVRPFRLLADLAGRPALDHDQCRALCP